jgi:hypothetical protein
MPPKLFYVYCETCEDWHIATVTGLKEECVVIAGHTLGAGMHSKIPTKEELEEFLESCKA